MTTQDGNDGKRNYFFLRTIGSLLSMYISRSIRSRTWIQMTRISACWFSLASRCINALASNADARKRVSGMPVGSRRNVGDFSNSSKSGKMTLLKSSSTCDWSSGSKEMWGPKINLWRCTIAVCRISREVLLLWRASTVRRGKLYWCQTREGSSFSLSFSIIAVYNTINFLLSYSPSSVWICIIPIKLQLKLKKKD